MKRNVSNSVVFMALAIAAASVLSTSSPGPVRAQKMQGAEKSLFGVTLTGPSAQLLAEVEQAFNVPLREEWLEDPAGMSGKSKVSPDGAPTVFVQRDHGRALDVIVHELYHLKLKAGGFPALLWLFPKEMDIPANHAAFAQLAEQVHDPIEHHLFYGTIRSWGINPGQAFEKRTVQMLNDGSLQRTYATMDRGAVALYWFKIRLEVEEGALTKRIREALMAAGKQDGMEFGETLTQIVLKANPNSAKAEIETMVAVLNAFYEGKFRFREHAWVRQQLGSFTQQAATIELVTGK